MKSRIRDPFVRFCERSGSQDPTYSIITFGITWMKCFHKRSRLLGLLKNGEKKMSSPLAPTSKSQPVTPPAPPHVEAQRSPSAPLSYLSGEAAFLAGKVTPVNPAFQRVRSVDTFFNKGAEGLDPLDGGRESSSEGRESPRFFSFQPRVNGELQKPRAIQTALNQIS